MKPWSEKDRNGNLVSLDEHGMVWLKLAREKRLRNIGYISSTGDYLKVGLKASKHRFRTGGGSWGINYVVLHKLKATAHIILHIEQLDGRHVGLQISTDDAKTHGRPMQFSKTDSGYELQLLVHEGCFSQFPI